MSDRSGRRIPFLALAFGAAAPALLLLAVARTTAVLLVAAFVLGFFLVSAMPIGMQYAAEIIAPTPEGTSNGVVQLVGQASVVFVYLMALTPTSGGSFLPSLAALAVLLLAGGVVALRLPEPVPTGRSAQVAGVR
jgi:MFS family permease